MAKKDVFQNPTPLPSQVLSTSVLISCQYLFISMVFLVRSILYLYFCNLIFISKLHHKHYKQCYSSFLWGEMLAVIGHQFCAGHLSHYLI